MGRGGIALVLLVCIVGALTGEARNHESFSASSYYETDDKKVDDPKDVKVNTEVQDPSNRYPNGYTNEEHHYNPVTQQYDEVDQKTTSEKDAVLPSSKEATAVDPAASIPKRYEAGYTNGQGSHPASYSQTTGTQTTTDPLVYDSVKGRYQLGYYPQKPTSTSTTTKNGESLAAEYSNQRTALPESDFMHRYEKGYFPGSEYTQHGVTHVQPKQVASYSSYAGNFNTMPYPNNGLPFVASGAGCRTAYWAENVAMWPSFFNVKSTVGDAFGAQATHSFGQTTILQALLKYGSDPFNELLRCACTALLNSYARGAYPLSHMKVIEQFNAALVSKEAATAQAVSFETDNVESISAGSACK